MKTLACTLLSVLPLLLLPACGSSQRRHILETTEVEGRFLRVNDTVAAVGRCQPVAVEVRGKLNYQLLATLHDVSVALTFGGGAVYADPACAAAAKTVTIATGTTHAPVYVKLDDEALDAMLQAEAPGFDPVAPALLSAQKDEPAREAELARVSIGGFDAAASLHRGECVPLALWQRVAGTQKHTTAAKELTHALVTSRGGFYADAGCEVPATRASWIAGSDLQIVWFRANDAGLALTAATSELGTASLHLTVQ